MSKAVCITAAAMLLAVASGCQTADAQDSNVCLHLRDGAKIILSFDCRPTAVFGSDNSLTLKGSYKEISTTSFEQLRKITFNEDAAGIRDIAVSGEGDFRQIGPKEIVLTGFKDARDVKVHSAAGSLLATVALDASGSASVSLEGYAAGLYLITAGNKSCKIIIK